MGSFMSKHSLANNRFIKDMPIEHDMHRDGPKNMNKGYGQEVPGGPPMYDKDKGGPPMHDEFTRKNNIKHGGPKNYDTDKGSHAHPHDGPKKQGYNARLDESLAMNDGKESTKSQSYKSRRDESKGEEKTNKKPAYSSNESSSQGPGMYKGKKKKKY